MTDRPDIFPDRESLTDVVVGEKLRSAESYSALVRLAIIIINAVAYAFLMERDETIPSLAWPIMVISLLYGFYVAIWEPFNRYPLKRTSYLTSVADAVFIVLWIIATGMASSPFFLMWYISIIAIAQRFTFVATLVTSVVYAVAYIAIVRSDIGYITSADMFLRVLYIPIVGVLAAFFSREFETQVEDKLKARRSEFKALSAKRKQRELLNELQSIRDGLEKTVQLRTADLTREMEEKEAAQRGQQQMVESLSRINAELESFAYVTSHDLKTPLRGIATIADWLLADYADKLDAEGKEHLNLMKQRVQRMNDLIDGILRYSRAGRLSDESEVIDVGNLIAESMRLMPVPDSTTITVEGNFPMVNTNRTTMVQVIENLVGNAVKYADATHGEVRISGKEKTDGWEMAIFNNGPGIAKEHHQRIFEIFQTLHHNGSEQSTGVGLSIVKKILKSWNAPITIDSDEKSNGTTFTFTIPNNLLADGDAKKKASPSNAKH